MNISDNIIKEQLKNVYFLCGGAYGGKTTMAKLIEEKYGFYRYRQGDHYCEHETIAKPEYQPALCLDRSKDWHGFFSQEPRKYADWMQQELREEAEFVITDLIKISKNKKIIVDALIPIDILKKISDYKHVILLLAPDEMKRKHYFDRADKIEVYEFILSFHDGETLLKNVIEALNIDNQKERYNIMNSGFKYIERTDKDTLEGTLEIIEQHFGLNSQSANIKKENIIDAIEIRKVDKDTELVKKLLDFVENSSWEDVKEHTLWMINNWVFSDWETIFVAMLDDQIVGMASIMKTDYYPLPEIYPWISSVFVTEEYRGHKISGKMIDFANKYAKEKGFAKTYIPSEHIGLYEQYGYHYLKDIVNYGNGIDRLYIKELK